MNMSDVKQLNKDKGFSLVELIIVVSILAIAAIPLMRSMALASRTNAKAQSIQNATSLAEKIMEEMKSTPMDTLKTKYPGKFTTDVAGNITFILGNEDADRNGIPDGISATQGESFIVNVAFNKSTYSGNTTPVPTSEVGYQKENVLSANTMLLPTIESIDTDTQAVLSPKEFNKYDSAAQSFFNQKIENYSGTNPAQISNKTIDISKDFLISSSCATVSAKVTYTARIDGKDVIYTRDLYSGRFFATVNEEGEYDAVLNSNIYLFYKKNPGLKVTNPETINITDPANGLVTHKIYFIRQDTSGGPILIINGTSYDTSSVNPAGTKEHVEIVTNLGAGGHIYKEEAGLRVYDITVVLTKPGDSTGTEYARLNSTISVDPTL